jgi:peroxin-7
MNVTTPGQHIVIQTPGFAHYSLAWSPFHTTRIALASSANFGLVGNGRLHLVSLSPGQNGTIILNLDKQFVVVFIPDQTRPLHITISSRYDTQDGLFDVAWSEIHENQLVTASGDGSIRLWDTTLNVGICSFVVCFEYNILKS